MFVFICNKFNYFWLCDHVLTNRGECGNNTVTVMVMEKTDTEKGLHIYSVLHFIAVEKQVICLFVNREVIGLSNSFFCNQRKAP